MPLYKAFVTRSVSGFGRGKHLGFPTINMVIPPRLKLAQGIFAVWVEIATGRYPGALHFGPVPVFGQVQTSLEVFLLDTTDRDLPDPLGPITITPVQRLRNVRSFPSVSQLQNQMGQDVAATRSVLR